MMAFSFFLITTLVLLFAYLYYPYGRHRVDLNSVLDGLLEAEALAAVSPDARVAVGFGSCLDVVGNGLVVLELLEESIPENPENFNEIHDINELKKTFAYFFMHGASAGRMTRNETLFTQILSILKGLPDTRLKLGGNAPVMTKRFDKETVEVLLAAGVPESHMKEFSPGISVVGGLVSASEVHLVLEYKRDAVWGKYVSTRANRFILYNQSGNNISSLLSDFATERLQYQPQLLVVGGLRMMLNHQSEYGLSGLDDLQLLLSDLPRSLKIHLEMSSFPDRNQLQSIVDSAVHYSDSMGMNEQELPNLRRILENGEITLVSDSHPRIAVTLDHMRSVFRKLHGTPESDGQRRLTRLHVHTLAYQVIMTAETSSWKNSRSAVAKASLTANRHTCGSDKVNATAALLLLDESFAVSSIADSRRIWFDQENPVTCWTEEGGIEICLAPVLVCSEVIQTVGGGDNVSAAGLVLQI